MRFLDPKNDYAFKRIFGSEESKDILISFLNAVLYQEQEIIKDLVIINPHALGATYDLKDTYLDVKAKLDNNTTVLIEMQLLNRFAFDKRVMYNAAKTYANQLDAGERYVLLQPVIALTIVDFILFKDSPEVINSFVFKEEKLNLPYNDEIKLVFIELPKFNKALEELNTLCEKWLFFLRNASSLSEKPSSLTSIKVLNHALEISNLAGLKLDELEEIQRRQMWLTDQETITMYAIDQGMQKGLQQGIQQGIEQGIQKGIEQGIQQGIEQGNYQKTKQILDRLIKKKFGEIATEIDHKINQLSLEKLELLTEELLDFSDQEQLNNWLNHHLN